MSSRLFQILILGLPALAFLQPREAAAHLRHGVIWYVCAQNPSDRDLAARRYEVGITGREGHNDFEKSEIRKQKPSFQWFLYNSGTDTYVPPNAGGLEEDNILSSGRALELGMRFAWMGPRDRVSALS